MASSPHNLSQRGVISKTPVRDDLDEFFTAWGDPYDPNDNTEGYLVLLVAENKLSWEMLKRKIESESKGRQIEDWVAGYGDFRGEVRFRAALSKMMEESFVKVPVDKDSLMVQAGCGAILDSLAWCLGEEGDSCICPAPLYPAFSNDFWARARIHLHVAQTFHPDYALTEEVLDKAFDECLAAGRPAKMLLLCNPCNPLGTIYGEHTLRMCLEWVEKKNIHLISDEIYALSIFPGESFTSVAQVAREKYPERGDMYLGPNIHLTYGFSKDWAMSGIRTGVLMSHNQDLIAAASNLSCFMAMSSYTQWLWTGILEDSDFVAEYIKTNQAKLFQCYGALEEALGAIGVHLTRCQGTLMAWADFRKHLRTASWDAELELWKELFSTSRILLTTGKSCRSSEPGFFRICYAWPAVTEEDPTVAMKELKARLIKHFKA